MQRIDTLTPVEPLPTFQGIQVRIWSDRDRSLGYEPRTRTDVDGGPILDGDCPLCFTIMRLQAGGWKRCIPCKTSFMVIPVLARPKATVRGAAA